MKKSLMMLSVFALSALVCSGQASAAAAAPPTLVRIYTDGLRGCKDGGSVRAYLTPAVERGALATLPLPSLEDALVTLSRMTMNESASLNRAPLASPVALFASAADQEAGLSVPSGQGVTLIMTCSGAYAATYFAPTTSTDLRFTPGQPIGKGWTVYVGQAPAVTGIPR